MGSLILSEKRIEDGMERKVEKVGGGEDVGTEVGMLNEKRYIFLKIKLINLKKKEQIGEKCKESIISLPFLSS